jgi:predicted O-methyltransferase YrrM
LSDKYPSLTSEAQQAFVDLVGAGVWRHLQELESIDATWKRPASPLEARSELMQAEGGIVRGWSISREQGLFLYSLVRILSPIRILELGASLGYSTSWLAAGARSAGASVVTIENDKEKLPILERTATLFADVVTIVRSDIKDVLSSTQSQFDVAFLDADPFQYALLTDLISGALAPRATLVIDNAISPSSLAGPVRALGASLDLNPTWTMPVGHGMLVGRRA